MRQGGPGEERQVGPEEEIQGGPGQERLGGQGEEAEPVQGKQKSRPEEGGEGGCFVKRKQEQANQAAKVRRLEEKKKEEISLLEFTGSFTRVLS